jgi:hypothetical protein
MARYIRSPYIPEEVIFLADIVRLGLGILLTFSGLQKGLHARAFRFDRARYTLVPDSIASVAAWTLLGLEPALGVFLLVGYRWRVALILTALLLLLFAAAVTIELLRGRTMECGCFIAGSGEISWTLPVRNLCAAGAAAASTLVSSSTEASSATMPLAATITAASLLLAYAAWNASRAILRSKGI